LELKKILNDVTIRFCRFLISIPALDDIPFISIKDTPLEQLQSNGNHTHFQLFYFPTVLNAKSASNGNTLAVPPFTETGAVLLLSS
jgi:hypothetical protein